MNNNMTHSPKRTRIGLGLMVLGVGFLVCCIWWMMWGMKDRTLFSAEKKESIDKLQDLDLAKEKDKEKEKANLKPKSGDYIPAGIWAGMMAVVLGGGGYWLLSKPSLNPGASLAIVETVTIGGLAGLLTSFLGIALGIGWYESLTRWIGSGQKAEAKWVLYAVAIFVTGLIIMFLFLQQGRSEQRNNALLRRVMYGFNSTFLGILLLLLLAAVNVVGYIKLPNTLVTNSTAFEELSPPAKEYLRQLEVNINIYLVLSEKQVIEGIDYENLYADCRGLMTQCRDISRKIRNEFLSPAFDREKIAALMDRLQIKENDRDQFGMIVTVEDDPTRTRFINSKDLVDIDRRMRAIVFQGENKLLNEMQSLTATTSDVIYFTQDHGELRMEGREDPRSISSIVQYLRDRRLTVKPLELKKATDKIPDDATLVVVAGPQLPMGPDTSIHKALAEYLAPKESGGRDGKLILLAPSFPAPGSNMVSATGLEPLLLPMGINLTQSRITGSRWRLGNNSFPAEAILAQPNMQVKIRLADALTRGGVILTDCRAVDSNPGGRYQAATLYYTPGRFPTYQETDFNSNPDLVWNQIENDDSLRVKKKVVMGGVSLATAVYDGAPGMNPQEKTEEKAKALIFGSDSLFADRPRIMAAPEDYRQILFSACVDWLRGKSVSMAIPPRKLSTYTVDKEIELSSQFLLLAMITIGIMAIGLGVWVSRRR